MTNQTLPRVALLSEANTPGAFRHAVNPERWQINGVEAIAWALDADVWHGAQLDALALSEFAERYDVLLVNLKPALWPLVPALVGALPCVRVCGFQEGPTDWIATLTGHQWADALAAHHAVDTLFYYDRTGASWFRLLNPSAAWLPIPAPLDIYPRHPSQPQWTEPARVLLGPMLDQGRGTALGIHAVGKAYFGATLVMRARSIDDAGRLARLAAEVGLIPDVDGWSAWTSTTGAPCFLDALASCEVAINLDPAATWGRLAVDCAGLGIPCIGSSRQYMQGKLWPELSVPDPCRDIARAVDLLTQALDGEMDHVAMDARARLEAFTPAATRAAFLEAL